MPNGVLLPGKVYEMRFTFTTAVEMADPMTVFTAIVAGYAEVKDVDVRELKEGHGK